MKKPSLSILCLSISIFLPNVFAQLPKDGNPNYEPSKQIELLRERQKQQDMKNGKDESGMIKQPEPQVNSRKLSDEEKERLKKRGEALEEKMNALKDAEKRLLPPVQYFEKYASFLTDKKTGLARLFVDKGCGIGKTVSAEMLKGCDDIIPVRGGGAFYSFRYKSNHFYGAKDGWDVYLFNGNKFLAGNETVQAIIADIGDINFEDLSSKSKALEFLEEYEPARTKTEIKEKNKILRNGISSNGYNYSNVADVKLNSTYVFRTIAYKPKNSGGNGLDLTIGFRVIGQEQDGSLIILWKEFKRELPRKELL
jgi:hypothetical protein